MVCGICRISLCLTAWMAVPGQAPAAHSSHARLQPCLPQRADMQRAWPVPRAPLSCIRAGGQHAQALHRPWRAGRAAWLHKTVSGAACARACSCRRWPAGVTAAAAEPASRCAALPARSEDAPRPPRAPASAAAQRPAELASLARESVLCARGARGAVRCRARPAAARSAGSSGAWTEAVRLEWGFGSISRTGAGRRAAAAARAAAVAATVRRPRPPRGAERERPLTADGSARAQPWLRASSTASCAAAPGSRTACCHGTGEMGMGK